MPDDELQGLGEFGGSTPAPEPLSLTLPYGCVTVLETRKVEHRFGSRDVKTTQRFKEGPGVKRVQVNMSDLDEREKDLLVQIFTARRGSIEPWDLTLYDPTEESRQKTYQVRFANPTLDVTQVDNVLWSSAFELLVEPGTMREFTSATTQYRFPSTQLQEALLAQVHEVIPFVKITPIDGATHRVSNQRCKLDGEEYAARLLDWDGISQSFFGADQATFVLGNADDYWTTWVNQIDFFEAVVEYSLYHVGQQAKVVLWKGYLETWDMDDPVQFRIRVSDGIPVRRAYPVRKVTRADGFVLPTSNQPVNVGGKKGIPSLPATSTTNETAYGKPLKDIWVNDSDVPLRVPCEVIAGRDESEYFAAIGIVGRGPIGGFGSVLKVQGGSEYEYGRVDSQPNHGPGTLGMRRSYGGNPVTGSPAQLNNSPDSGSHILALDETGAPLPDNPAPDGVAFQQVRRTDEKGIQPSNATSQHEMITFVSQGLGGWVWSGAGPYTRTWTRGITNPTWVALNTFLVASHPESPYWLYEGSQSDQEALFDVPAAIAAAAVHDQTVTKMVGAGTEKQFQFVGVVGAEEKPLRDWLRDILAGSLSYFTFAAGKLRIGTRFHSGAQEAFDEGNILFNSLRLSSYSPEYNDLTLTYACRDYVYQSDTMQFKIDDHINKYGRRVGNLNLPGVTTKSQAARLVTCLVREAIGGVDETEWTRARRLSFQTTVLALNVEPGTICSMTHPRMPTGVLNGEEQAQYGEFIVESWRLNKDWSISITGRTTTDSMYDMLVGDKPSDVAINPTAGEIDKTPGIFTFEPGLYEYGTISIDQCQLAAGANRGLQSLVAYFAYVDELTTDVWVELSELADAAETSTVTVTPNASRTTPPETLDFAVGDYILINDPDNQEIALITAIAGNQWTIQRYWPGVAADQSIFLFKRVAHEAGVKAYKIQLTKRTWDCSTGSYDDVTDTTAVPGRFDADLPNATVCAIIAAVRSGYGYSPWTVYPLRTAELPGVRTLHGGNYTITISGGLAIGERLVVPKRVQFPSSIRVAYAQVLIAPTGASVICTVDRSTDEGENWTAVATLTIADGEVTSFDPETAAPGDRRVPYAGEWPFPVLTTENLISCSITQVGTTDPGQDLVIEVLT